MAQLSVSLFAADQLAAGRDLDILREYRIQSLHVDIMDGQFVPLLGVNQGMLERIVRDYRFALDIHFMTAFHMDWILEFLNYRPDKMILHLETAHEKQLSEMLQCIHDKGVKRGIAISPDTSVENLVPLLPKLDEVLVMTTYPGQKDSMYLEDSDKRISEVQRLIRSCGCDTGIAVDGGMNETRALSAIRHGADRIIMGRAFFAANDKERMISMIGNTCV